MIKKILAIISLLGLFLVSIQSASALQTYVGVKILNLTDDPAASCAGEAGYGSQGRIRAISSILPDYPIYFELRNVSDNSLIWSGDSTDDTDYEIGDVIQIPQLLDLTIGQDYKLFFDIDAIRIYLPLENYKYLSSDPIWEATLDDNYWTAGKIGSGDTYEYEALGTSNTCELEYMLRTYQRNMNSFLSNNRSSNLISTCTTDSQEYNCVYEGIIGVIDYSSTEDNDFKINRKYDNLHTSTVGNFEITFTLN